MIIENIELVKTMIAGYHQCNDVLSVDIQIAKPLYLIQNWALSAKDIEQTFRFCCLHYSSQPGAVQMTSILQGVYFMPFYYEDCLLCDIVDVQFTSSPAMACGYLYRIK